MELCGDDGIYTYGAAIVRYRMEGVGKLWSEKHITVRRDLLHWQNFNCFEGVN